MTFSVNVPNAAQSPGVFPAQNNMNFQRLQAIIDNDHNFTNSVSAAQGIHKKVTLINSNPAPSGVLAAGNGVLYSFLDGAESQLHWYNGVNDYVITPAPRAIVGSQAVTANTTVTIFADPGYRYCGTGWAIINGTPYFNFYNLLRAATNDLHILDSNSIASPPVPTFSFGGSGNRDLMITNNHPSSTLTLVWSLIINRIPSS